MRRSLILFILLAFASVSKAQYWFGPKIGTHVVSHRYQLSEYKSDSFQINPDLRWQIGFALTYAASERYSVHTEINFERIGRTLRNNENDFPIVTSRLTSSFITVPLMLRFNFGAPPVHFYLNGGPKISFWLGGRGKIADLDEFEEFRSDDPQVEYRLAFSDRNRRPDDPDTDEIGIFQLQNGNIVQYALTIGGGALFDLRRGQRLMLDIRFSYGHSNMGFNENVDFTFDTYEENFEYTHDMLSVSLGYMFEFDKNLNLRGRSTSNVPGKNTKKTRKKRN